MKLKQVFNSQCYTMIFFILLFLFSACKKNTDVSPERSTTPAIEELGRSNLFKFISEVQSVSIDKREKMINKFIQENPGSPVIENENLAGFYWFGNASSVLINGDIQNAWASPDSMIMIDCGNDNFFYRIYSLPSDARIDYTYVVDGKTITDPRNKVITPSGYGMHSQCAMPLFKAKTIKEFNPAIAHGSIDSLFLRSKAGSISSRWIKVFKPAGYDTIDNLPCLYVNDGFKALEYCSYINILDNLIASGKISPVVVVFIDFIEGDQEYFLNKTDEYINMLCSELVPLIDKNYKTAKSPRKRVIAGISAGGQAAILVSLKRSDVFFNSAGQSSTITSNLLTSVGSAASDKNKSKLIKIYMDVARFDLQSGAFNNYSFLYSNQLLSRELKTYGINHLFKVVNDGHQWANWRERIDEILIYFFQPGINT